MSSTLFTAIKIIQVLCKYILYKVLSARVKLDHQVFVRLRQLQ